MVKFTAGFLFMSCVSYLYKKTHCIDPDVQSHLAGDLFFYSKYKTTVAKSRRF